MAGGHVWLGACMVRGVHGQGVCVARGHEWLGACVVKGMHGWGGVHG